jgi:hypothetical protein
MRFDEKKVGIERDLDSFSRAVEGLKVSFLE